MKRLQVGTFVDAFDQGRVQRGWVLRHGRDASGPYTAIRLTDGTVSLYHRDAVTPARASSLGEPGKPGGER